MTADDLLAVLNAKLRDAHPVAANRARGFARDRTGVARDDASRARGAPAPGDPMYEG